MTDEMKKARGADGVYYRPQKYIPNFYPGDVSHIWLVLEDGKKYMLRVTKKGNVIAVRTDRRPYDLYVERRLGEC